MQLPKSSMPPPKQRTWRYLKANGIKRDQTGERRACSCNLCDQRGAKHNISFMLLAWRTLWKNSNAFKCIDDDDEWWWWWKSPWRDDVKPAFPQPPLQMLLSHLISLGAVPSQVFGHFHQLHKASGAPATVSIFSDPGKFQSAGGCPQPSKLHGKSRAGPN